MYQKIGFQPVPLITLLRDVCGGLLTKDYQATVNEFAVELAKNDLIPFKFYKLDERMLGGLRRDIQLVASTVLAKGGRLVGQATVPLVAAVLDPALSVRYQEELIVDSMLPEPAPGEANFPMFRAHLANECAKWLSAVRQVIDRRPLVRQQMNDAANHLLYLVQQGHGMTSLSQKERSFLLFRFHPYYSTVGFDPNAAAEYDRPPPIPQPVFNPLALEHLAPLFARVEDAPQTKLLMRLSSRDRENPTISITPYVPTLRTAQGFIEEFGNTSKLDLVPGVAMPWDVAEHLAAATELARPTLFLPRDGNRQVCLTYNIYLGPDELQRNESTRIRLVWDDANLCDWRYDARLGTLVSYFETTYYGVPKQMATIDPTMELLLHLSLQPDAINTTPVHAENLDKFGEIYADRVRDYLIDLGTEAQATPANQVTVYYYATERDAANGVLSKRVLHAGPLVQYGKHLVRPFLAAYALKSLNFLFTADEAASRWIFSNLGLNLHMERRNALPVQMSWNAFVAGRVFGRTIPDLETRIAVVTRGHLSATGA